MKMLLSTTAMVITLALPTLALAQAAAPAANPAHQQGDQMAGFLDQRSASDLFASELIGHDVYARTTPAEAGTTGTAGTSDQGMMTMSSADLEGMENIGQINEIVLSNDGQVRAIVIGAGGFLGMGEHDIAVTMDQITLASDADDRSEMYIVVNSGTDALRESPAYNRTAMTGDQMQGNTGMGTDANATTEARTEGQDTMAAAPGDRTGFTAPQVERDGYNNVEATEVTTDLLTGKNVYDVNDNDVGTVTDMVLDDKGAITNVIIDFGGFLGIGVSQASLNFDELTILSTQGNDDVRLYVDATREQIQALPQYEPAN